MDNFTMNEAIDSDGFCFSKEKNQKNIVLGALPSEEVACSFLGRKRRESYYILDEVIKPSPQRVHAPCADVPRCGGCLFQQLDYSQQLFNKQIKIENLFPEDSSKCLPIIASPKIFHYRAKMDFSFSQNKAGNKFLGLTQAKGNGRVMMTNYCHLAQPWMNEALKIMQGLFAQSDICAFDRKGHGDLRSFILREGVHTKEKMLILEVVAHPNSQLKKDKITAFFNDLRTIDPEMSCYLRIVQQIPKMPTQIYEMHLFGPSHIHEVLQIGNKKFKFKISPSAFFQPNPFTAEILLNKILEIISPLKAKKICDLFCGTGTIGIAVSSIVDSCISVEINPYAVFDAKENAELNKIQNITFVQQDANCFVKEHTGDFDLVIVDPPRAGLGTKACELIDKFQAKYILYVSCNPVTQALDYQILKDKGYAISLIQPLDQFPHTNHVENILLLEKTEA
jgi:23S rRNA (uracil1939-C5)-methyltransferase